MDIYELAELMHSKDCKINHIDGCGWYYENSPGYRDGENKWTIGYAHKTYLEKAHKIEAETGMPLHQIAEVIRAL